MGRAVGVTQGTTGEIDTDPEGVEKPMTTGFIRPLRGRNLLFVLIRGFDTHGYSHSSPLGMGNAA
jgi:hypothetical protein